MALTDEWAINASVLKVLFKCLNLNRFDKKITKNIILVGLAIRYSKKTELGGKANMKKQIWGQGLDRI